MTPLSNGLTNFYNEIDYEFKLNRLEIKLRKNQIYVVNNMFLFSIKWL